MPHFRFSPLLALTRTRRLAAISLALGWSAGAHAASSGYTFSTLAGQTLLGGVDGPGDQASFSLPFGIAVAANGNLFVADTSNQTIRKITPDHVVSTYVGQPGRAGATDSSGFAAQFNYPRGVAVDRLGNFYVADGQNHTIRKVSPDRQVTTLAGLAGAPGSADGVGADARFNNPNSVAVDADGTVYVADLGNSTIRKITPNGAVTTLAGLAGSSGVSDGRGSAARFVQPSAVAVDRNGLVYVTDFSADTVRTIAPDGTVTTIAGLANTPGTADGAGSAARFFFPAGIGVDASGNLYVSEYKNGTIRKITPDHVVTTLAGDPDVSGSNDGVGRAAHFYTPAGDAVDDQGNVYVADSGNSSIRAVSSAGVVATIAGHPGSAGSVDGTGHDARFNYPAAVAADVSGNLYVADGLGRTVRKITSAGVVTTLAGSAGQIGSTDGRGTAARFGFPEGIAVDAAGNVFVADGDNFTIRKITPSGDVSVFAGQTGRPGTADGTGTAAQFNEPVGLAFDNAGNLFVADRGGATIRRITPAGAVSTYAGQPGMPGNINGTSDVARFVGPRTVAVDPRGNVLVGDGNGTIREVTPDRFVTLYAGVPTERRPTDGPLAVARFGSTDGLAIDPLGNIFVADATANAIRRIDSRGMVTTVGGVAGVPGGTDGSDAEVRFNYPTALALDPFGNLYVADTANNTVRKAVSTTRLVNLSIRSSVGVGDQTLIVGFVIAGSDPKPVLLRGIGPTLAGMGVANANPDPRLTLFDRHGTPLQENNDWGGAEELAAAFAALGAFPLPPTSKDSALYTSLQPGVYTSHLGSVAGANGVGLAEIYDGDLHTSTRIVNASARTVTGGGDNVLIAGFVLVGDAPKTVLVRGVGPSLVAQGVGAASVVADPQLSLYRGGVRIDGNNDWAGSPALKYAFHTVGAFDLDSDNSRDAALLATLDPGAYTAVVSGANNTAGVALVEVYETP